MSNVAMKGICWRDVNESECSCPKCFGCRRKKGFSKTKAFKIASSMNNNSRRRNARAKAYNCPWCDDWHVGHDNKLVPLWKQKNIRSTR